LNRHKRLIFQGGKTLTIIEIINTFAFYGLDKIMLAAVTCIAVQLLKNTILKNCKKKIVTFLPFMIGTVFYAIFISIYKLNAVYIIKNYTETIESGFGVGTLSTVIYVCYEQFVRDKQATSVSEGVIATLIDGYVPDDEVEEIAAAIVTAIQMDVIGDGEKKTAAILAERTNEGVTEMDINLLSKLIIETLAHINNN
jgi:hypothetical protein